MGWDQQIEYVDADARPALPVKKQVWDGEKFVPMTLCKHKGVLNKTAEEWMRTTFGPRGVYKNGHFWDYSRGANFTLMDEKVYVWYQIKWGNK